MKILKNNFYPVDVVNKIIYLRPYKTFRELLSARWGRNFLGFKGLELMRHKTYKSFKILPNKI